MEDTPALTILKSALLLEQRGRTLYTMAARQAGDEAVRAFFQMLADEEGRHIRVLSAQFSAVAKGGAFTFSPATAGEESLLAPEVLAADLCERIAASDYEAAAISAAMAMEERAVKLYARRAEESHDGEEKALYRWLSHWETQHLETLAAIERSLTEKIWNDNNFWPF